MCAARLVYREKSYLVVPLDCLPEESTRRIWSASTLLLGPVRNGGVSVVNIVQEGCVDLLVCYHVDVWDVWDVMDLVDVKGAMSCLHAARRDDTCRGAPGLP